MNVEWRKIFGIVILISFNCHSFAQVDKIKIVKDKTEKSGIPSVKVCGIKKGEVSLTKLKKDSKFKIENNADSLIIKHVVVVIYFKDGEVKYANHADSIINPVFNLIKAKNPKEKFKLTLSEIVAIDKFKKERVLINVELMIVP